jgi:hypothetical protein
MSTQETGHITGTKDKDYNLIWFTEACLSNALRLETYIQGRVVRVPSRPKDSSNND